MEAMTDQSLGRPDLYLPPKQDRLCLIEGLVRNGTALARSLDSTEYGAHPRQRMARRTNERHWVLTK